MFKLEPVVRLQLVGLTRSLLRVNFAASVIVERVGVGVGVVVVDCRLVSVWYSSSLLWLALERRPSDKLSWSFPFEGVVVTHASDVARRNCLVVCLFVCSFHFISVADCL